jgi:hypothetical protein
MDMKLKEVIAALNKIQEIAGEDAPTNISHLRLRVGVAEKYDAYGYVNYGRDRARETHWSVWADAYVDGPSLPPPDCTTE